MRALVVTPPGNPFAIEDLPDPTPGEHELVVKVGRCGVCGTDISWTSGETSNGMIWPVGSVIGHEWAGEVVALGKNVEGVKVGDLVTGMCGVGCGHCLHCAENEPFMCGEMKLYAGGFGQYMLSHDKAAVVLPKSLSMADGALVEPLAIGLHGVTKSGMSAGDRVLVIGAGSVGLAAIYWARKLGAGRIVAASRSDRRAAMAQAMGADAFVTTGDDEVARIREALGGEPDVVFECAGVPGMLAKSIEHVRRKGIVMSLGFCTSDDPVVPGLAGMKQVQLRFAVAYTLGGFEHAARELDRDALPDPRVIVSDTFGLDAFPGVIDELRGPNDYSKVHLDPWA
jgi:threonine dehydrogenase-like Zn-dependent dehydrogenase